MRKAQISIEYLIIIGVVVFLIVLPSAIFLSTFAQTTIYGAVTSEQADQVGRGLTQAAQQVFYLGLFAQKKVSLPMPNNVEEIVMFTITVNSNDFHYLVIRIDDGVIPQTFYYQSRAPLIADPNLYASSTLPSYIAECAGVACNNVFVFRQPVTFPGLKQFSLETVRRDGRIAVLVTPEVD